MNHTLTPIIPARIPNFALQPTPPSEPILPKESTLKSLLSVEQPKIFRISSAPGQILCPSHYTAKGTEKTTSSWWSNFLWVSSSSWPPFRNLFFPLGWWWGIKSPLISEPSLVDTERVRSPTIRARVAV